MGLSIGLVDGCQTRCGWCEATANNPVALPCWWLRGLERIGRLSSRSFYCWRDGVVRRGFTACLFCFPFSWAALEVVRCVRFRAGEASGSIGGAICASIGRPQKLLANVCYLHGAEHRECMMSLFLVRCSGGMLCAGVEVTMALDPGILRGVGYS